MFGSAKKGKTYPELKPLDAGQVQRIVQLAVEKAVEDNQGTLKTEREKADKYYQGQTDLETTEGRSQIVVSKVRDAVKSVLPSMARIFTQTDVIGEFWSDDEEDQIVCTQATKYANNIFSKYGGYVALIESITDSLKAKIGVMEVYAEKIDVPVHTVYTMPPPAPGAELPLPGVATETNGQETVVTKLRKKVKWTLCCIPPEEFFISANATSVDDAYVCGRQTNKTVSELVAMGFDFDEVKDLDNFDVDSEDEERVDGNTVSVDDHDTGNLDPSAKVVGYTVAYLRVDADGDGVAELRRLVLGGSNYKVLADEPANFAPYAIFKAELQPHVLQPICLAEDTIQDQDSQTAILRSIIDNVALVNSPRTEVNETMVNLDDVQNGEIGAIIRVRQMGQINELATPFVAGQTLPVLEYLNGVSEQRSGITRMSQGLDPDALQSTTKVAAQAAVSGSDARIEMMARNIAETGVTNMLMCILKTAIYIIKDKQSISLPDGFYQVDPTMWHDQLNIKPNVGLGSGRIEEKRQTLAQVLPLQQLIMDKFGYANPVCGWTQVRETLKDMLRLSGIHDYSKYFPFVPPEKIAELDKQAQEANMKAQQEQQAAAMEQQKLMTSMVEIEKQKSELKYQADMSKIQQKHMSDMQKLQAQLAELQTKLKYNAVELAMKDDLERDKALLDFTIDAAKVKLDAQEIEQAKKEIEETRVTTNVN
jgi:hypothetical protein